MITIPTTVLADENGYYDRECPNKDCLYSFKILMKDWIEKVSDDEVHCPMCGHVDSSDKWWTQSQLNQIRENAVNYARDYILGELDKTFKDLERSTRRNKYVRFTYKPSSRVSFINNPIGQSKKWETEICCESCGTHYSVIGSAYFCPCCGYNSAVNSFNDSLGSIQKMLESLREMKVLLIDKYNKDTAETMCRSLLESSIGDIVSAFQKFAACKYEEISGKPARVNDFQIVDKGSNLFEQETGNKYSDWLTTSELDFMTIMFQKRHLLEHNNGMVDQKYIDKSGDTSYNLGQRIVVKEKDAYTLLNIIRKLGNEIIKLNSGGESSAH